MSKIIIDLEQKTLNIPPGTDKDMKTDGFLSITKDTVNILIRILQNMSIKSLNTVDINIQDIGVDKFGDLTFDNNYLVQMDKNNFGQGDQNKPFLNLYIVRIDNRLNYAYLYYSSGFSHINIDLIGKPNTLYRLFYDGYIDNLYIYNVKDNQISLRSIPVKSVINIDKCPDSICIQKSCNDKPYFISLIACIIIIIVLIMIIVMKYMNK